MGGGFSQSQSSSSPFFLPGLDKAKKKGGQLQLATEALFGILAPRAFGGAPDPATEAALSRSREQLTQTFAERGLAGSGIEAKAQALFEGQAQAQREAGILDIVSRIMGPLGQKSSSSSLGITLPSLPA
jgi:hypothetical protein